MNKSDYQSAKKAVKAIVNQAMAAADDWGYDPMGDMYGYAQPYFQDYDFTPYIERINAVVVQAGGKMSIFAMSLRADASKGIEWNNDCSSLLQTMIMYMGMDI